MAVACGIFHTVAVDEFGRVLAFGRNTQGQLGTGRDENQKHPTLVPGLPAPVRQVAASGWHTAMVTDKGGLLMCGDGKWGQLGLGDRVHRFRPTLISRAVFDGEAVLTVACGLGHTALVTEGGVVYTFGFGSHGRLGLGDEESHLVPRRIPAGSFNNEKIVMIDAGAAFTVALSEAGNVFTWGHNYYGQLGHNDFDDQMSPRRVEVTHFHGETVVYVAANSNHAMAVTAEGRLYTWGDNTHGQLGRNNMPPHQVPGVVTIGSEFSTSSGGGVVMAVGGQHHTLARMKDGSLWACGHGNQGQLGIENFRDGPDCRQFERIDRDESVLRGAKVVTIAAGYKHSAAVTDDGALWTWGEGNWDKLGLFRDDIGFCSLPHRVNSWRILKGLVGRFHEIPNASVLAFAMGAHHRLGAASLIRMVSGEDALLSMIAQSGNTFWDTLPAAVKKSVGLLRLMGLSQQSYVITMPLS